MFVSFIYSFFYGVPLRADFLEHLFLVRLLPYIFLRILRVCKKHRNFLCYVRTKPSLLTFSIIIYYFHAAFPFYMYSQHTLQVSPLPSSLFDIFYAHLRMHLSYLISSWSSPAYVRSHRIKGGKIHILFLFSGNLDCYLLPSWCCDFLKVFCFPFFLSSMYVPLIGFPPVLHN